jgi:hypothetical protein
MGKLAKHARHCSDLCMANYHDQAAIGVWYKPRQCPRHRYEPRPVGDTAPPAGGCGRCPSSPACVRWPL